MAIMGLTKALFAHSHIAWSNHRNTYEEKLKNLVFKKKIGWPAALESIIGSDDFAKTCSRAVYSGRGGGRYDDDSYDDDWGRGECWNCGGYGHYRYECYY